MRDAATDDEDIVAHLTSQPPLHRPEVYTQRQVCSAIERG